MKDNSILGVVLACKFKSDQLQYAFVTTTGIYRMVSELFNNEHDLSRITKMRNNPKDVERFLRGQPEFKFYSKEFTHLPGVSDFLKNGVFDKDRLEEVERINPSTDLTLEYLAVLSLNSINIAEMGV